MERPNKEDYDFNDIFEVVRFANNMIRYADYLEVTNRCYKIVKIDRKTGRQLGKRVYTSHSDYIKYKDEVTKRYLTYARVEHYQLVNDKWKVLDLDPIKENCNHSSIEELQGGQIERCRLCGKTWG